MPRQDRRTADELRLVGCCGANCGTCRSFIRGQCRGCRVGYDDGTRDLAATKCRVKMCCLGRGTLVTCADCGEYQTCERILSFHESKESKYKEYTRPVEYIRTHGYSEYLKNARKWKGPFGRLD